MFVAIGTGSKRSPDGSVTLNVRIFDGEPAQGKMVRGQSFTGPDLTACMTQLRAQLRAMKDAQDDTTLNDQVAGKELARV